LIAAAISSGPGDVGMAPTRSEIKTLLDAWLEAVRRKDIERLLALYAPGIVYFDVVPPLQIKGLDAVRRNFMRWFNLWNGDIDAEIDDLHISQSGSLATAVMLYRVRGTLKPGLDVDYWVRATVSCQRLDQGWRITHEHVSLPIDFQSGNAVMNLEP
jgi:ketosteroid isomerase-like protein